MSALGDFARRMAMLIRGERFDREMEEEMRLHRELRERELRDAGAAPRDAHDAAQRQFGNALHLREESRAMYRWNWLEHLAQDARFGLRVLRKSPAYSVAAVLTLALGIGLTTSIYTAVDALALRPLPYQAPDRLMAIESREAHHPENAAWSSAPDFFDLRDHVQSFSFVAAVSPVWNVALTGLGEAERLESLFISADLLPMLGVSPVLGRGLQREDDNRTAHTDVVLLSYAFWQRKFGSDPAAIGRKINLDSSTCTIIGVLPRDFRYFGEPVAGTAANIDVWLPLAANQLIARPRFLRFLKVIGRLKPGVSAAQARDEIRRFGAALGQQYPDTDAGLEYDAVPFEQQVVGRVRPMMFLMLGAVGFVLLLACANVANLLLTMTAARGKEMAVRAALGASRLRLLRQLLTESLLLACAGTLAGVILARWLLKALLGFAPATLLGGRTISLDGRVLVVITGIAFVSAILCGLPPAWRISHTRLESGLREAGRGFTLGNRRFRSTLVVVQMSLALLLLIGAGLLIRGFARLLDVDSGFDPRHVATLSTQLPSSVQTLAQALTMDRLTLDRVRQMPGVRSVGAVSRLPLLGSNLGSTLWIEGRTYPPDQQPGVEYRVASPDYFTTMRIPLRAGRLYDEHDETHAATVVLINETTAKRYWPGANPVGQRIKLGADNSKQDWITIVGVVGDVRHSGLDAAALPEVYRPIAYSALVSPIIVARTDGEPAALLPSLSAAVRSLDPTMPVYNAFPMQALVDRSVAQRRFLMTLLACFAGAALLLAAIGLYGTMSQSVGQRTKEFGLRMALGAPRAHVLRMILAEGLWLVLLGVFIGGVAGAALTRAIRSLLFQVSPLDPGVFAAAAATLAAVAVFACFAPAVRATGVDPSAALRQE
jgi:predicted permease